MDLQEFVAETIVSINDGIKEAINRIDASGGIGTINPHWRGPDANWRENIDRVEFDIAVTASDSTGGKGRAGIKVLSIELGAEGTKTVELSSVSKVKFSVAVIFPASIRDAIPTTLARPNNIQS